MRALPLCSGTPAVSASAQGISCGGMCRRAETRLKTFPLLNTHIQYQNAAGIDHSCQQIIPIFFFKDRDMIQGTPENMQIQTDRHSK